MDLLVEITVTDGCNRNCSYCFEKNRKPGPDRFDEWKPVLAKLCRDFEAGAYPGRDRLLLTFWGGEPFLRSDRMLDVLDMTAGYGFVSYHVYTNATLKDQTESFVADPRFKAAAGRFSAQVSYDGSPLNERSRGYGFDDIRGQVSLLAGAGAAVSFKATVRYGDVGLMPAAWDSYAELAAEWPGVKYAPTLDSVGDPRAASREWPAVVKELCRREYAFYRRNGRFLMSWFDEESPKSCRLRDRVFLHSDGVQYVCHGCPYSPDERFILGSVESGAASFAGSDGAGLPAGCAGCDATYCVYCNMAGMPRGRLEDAWNAGRVGAACGMYREFGWHSRMLRYALLKGK